MPVVAGIDRCDKSLEFLRVRFLLAIIDNVDCHAIFFELFREFDQDFRIFWNGRAHEGDDPLLLVLVLAMLERELRHLQGRNKIRFSGYLDLGRAREQPSEILSQRNQDSRAVGAETGAKKKKKKKKSKSKSKKKKIIEVGTLLSLESGYLFPAIVIMPTVLSGFA